MSPVHAIVDQPTSQKSPAALPRATWQAGRTVLGAASTQSGNLVYAGYPYDGQDGREEPAGADARVLRGGAFNSNPWNLRCAYRDHFDPVLWSSLLGFRVVVASHDLCGVRKCRAARDRALFGRGVQAGAACPWPRPASA